MHPLNYFIIFRYHFRIIIDISYITLVTTNTYCTKKLSNTISDCRKIMYTKDITGVGDHNILIYNKISKSVLALKYMYHFLVNT